MLPVFIKVGGKSVTCSPVHGALGWKASADYRMGEGGHFLSRDRKPWKHHWFHSVFHLMLSMW